MGEYSEEDIGNIVSLEHVNVQIPDQSLATLFYVVGMGFTRDPYLNVGLNNMWANVGEQQFHLPTRSPQVIDGHIGVVVPNLDALEARLKTIGEGLKGSKFAYSRERRFYFCYLSLGQSLSMLFEPALFRRHDAGNSLRRIRGLARRAARDFTVLPNRARGADGTGERSARSLRPGEDRPSSVAVISRSVPIHRRPTTAIISLFTSLTFPGLLPTSRAAA